MKTIVIGYDDSESAKRALARVAQLADAFDAYVIAVSAARALVPAGHGIGPIDPTDPPELHRDELGRAKALLDELDIPADYRVGLGDPADAILAAAESEHADLIVVGRPKRLLPIRSTAIRLLRESDRALLIVPATASGRVPVNPEDSALRRAA